MSKHNDWIDKFFDYDLSLKTRTIYLGSPDDDSSDSEVNASMTTKVIKCLHVLDNSGLEAKNGRDPITIVMNNPGGYVYDGLGIYDAIRTCKNHITIQVFGVAMSMGALILQAGDVRQLSENSTLMIHYGEHGGFYHSPTVHKWEAEAKRLERLGEDILLKRIRDKHPKFQKRRLRQWLLTDTFFSAKDAVKWNLADSIIDS